MSSTEQHPNEAVAPPYSPQFPALIHPDPHGINGQTKWLAAEVVHLSAELDELRAQRNSLVDRVLAAEARIEAIEALLEHADVIGDYVHVETLRSALASPLLPEDTTNQPTVEIGGVTMTQAQFDAARYPLLNLEPCPAAATSELEQR